jgi:hypothetical protein
MPWCFTMAGAPCYNATLACSPARRLKLTTRFRVRCGPLPWQPALARPSGYRRVARRLCHAVPVNASLPLAPVQVPGAPRGRRLAPRQGMALTREEFTAVHEEESGRDVGEDSRLNSRIAHTVRA